ncbi:MAG: ATP-binding protein [Inquilinaceae bacterium]
MASGLPPPSGPSVTDGLNATTVMETDPRPVGIFAPDGTLAYRNQAFLDAVFPTRSHGQLRPIPAFAAMVDRVRRLAADMDAGPHSETTTFRVPARRTFKIDYVRLDDATAPEALGGGIIVYMTDVSAEIDALREAEADRLRLSDLMRSSADWVWEISALGEIRSISESFSEIVGYPVQSLKGCRFDEFAQWIEPEVGDITESREFRERLPFRGFEFNVPDTIGGFRRQRITGVPLFDQETGQFLGFRGTGTDVTLDTSSERMTAQSQIDLEATLEQLKLRNADLLRTLEEAQSANLAKSSFLANMSHELRTPLNAVIGYAEALESGVLRPDSDKYRQIASDIAHAGHHLLHLINDVLDMAKIDNNQIDITVEPAPVGDILRDAYSFIMLAASRKRIDTRQVLVANGPWVRVDRVRAVQIFVNLLNNAVKFTPEGGQIGVRVGLAASDMAEIVVWDSGPGIPQNRREDIFSPFIRVKDDAHTQSGGGAGLGLTISRHLARLMGGAIEVRERDAGGSEFVVTLPIAEPGQTTDANVTSLPPRGPTAG